METHKQRMLAADIAMLAVTVVAAVIVETFVGLSAGLGLLLGCFFWGAVIYGLVFGAYAIVGNRSRAPQSRRFILIAATIVAVLGSLGIVVNHQDKTTGEGSRPTSPGDRSISGDGHDSEVSQQLALQQKQQEIDLAKLQQKAEERKRDDLYRSALVDTLGEIKKASSAPDLAHQVAALKQLDVTGCPPEFRKEFLDLVYYMDEVQQVDLARKRLSSDESVSEIFLQQVEQMLAKSSNSRVDDALTEDQQLLKARGMWLQQARAADHNIQLVAAEYGLSY